MLTLYDNLEIFSLKKTKTIIIIKNYWKPVEKTAKVINMFLSSGSVTSGTEILVMLESVIVLGSFDEKSLHVLFNSWGRSFLEKQESSGFPWGGVVE